MGYFKLVEEGKFKDRFALKATGVVVEEVGDGFSRCSMQVSSRHMDFHGHVSPGAIFTLADFAFGAAANERVQNAVTLSSDINFVRPTTGPRLVAEARCIKDGRRICFFEVVISDARGVAAVAHTNGFRS